MGYTHYFYSKLNKEQIISVMNDIEKIIQKGTENGYLEGGKIGNARSLEERRELPIYDRERGVISFNGDVNLNSGNKNWWDSELNHESFAIIPFANDEDEFNFCKTARKPYDKLVVASLFRLGYLFPDDFHWASDGRLIQSISKNGDGEIELSQDFIQGLELVWNCFHQKTKTPFEELEKLLKPLEEFRSLDEDTQSNVLYAIFQKYINASVGLITNYPD